MVHPRSLPELCRAPSPRGPAATLALPVLSLSSHRGRSAGQSPSMGRCRGTSRVGRGEAWGGGSCAAPLPTLSVSSCVGATRERARAAIGAGGASRQFWEVQLEAHPS